MTIFSSGIAANAKQAEAAKAWVKFITAAQLRGEAFKKRGMEPG